MRWLAAILGFVTGTVVWPAFIRLPPQLARWLCAPYGPPSRLGIISSFLASIMFLTIVLILFFIELSYLITAPDVPSTLEAKHVRGIVFISSLFGYALLPIITRIERIVSQRKEK
jgi:hypothetical protein